jgi:hypothetical protein
VIGRRKIARQIVVVLTRSGPPSPSLRRARASGAPAEASTYRPGRRCPRSSCLRCSARRPDRCHRSRHRRRSSCRRSPLHRRRYPWCRRLRRSARLPRRCLPCRRWRDPPTIFRRDAHQRHCEKERLPIPAWRRPRRTHPYRRLHAYPGNTPKIRWQPRKSSLPRRREKTRSACFLVEASHPGNHRNRSKRTTLVESQLSMRGVRR